MWNDLHSKITLKSWLYSRKSGHRPLSPKSFQQKISTSAALVLRGHRPLSYLGYIGRFRPKNFKLKNFQHRPLCSLGDIGRFLQNIGCFGITSATLSQSSAAFGRTSAAFIQTSAALSNIGCFQQHRPLSHRPLSIFDIGRFRPYS